MGHTFISDDAFRSRMKAQVGKGEKVKGGPPIAKASGFVEKAADGQTLFVLSTATADRSNDVVEQSGWQLDNYRPNPVVLFAHDHEAPPVGRSPNVYLDEKNRLVAKGPVFTEADVNPFGAMIGKMVAAGFLRAASVGFIPLEWTWNEERGMFAMDFKRQELIEWSVVPVPANPEALVGAKSAGIDVGPMLKWASKAIDEKRRAGVLEEGELVAICKAIAPRVHQVHREQGAATVCICDAGPLVKCQECGGHTRAAISDDAFSQQGEGTGEGDQGGKAFAELRARVEALEQKAKVAPPARDERAQEEFELEAIAAAAAAEAKKQVEALLGRVVD